MDFFASDQQPTSHLVHHIIPYAILALNCVLFKLLRSFTSRFISPTQTKQKKSEGGWTEWIKLFADELIATCELCADCAELNIVYEKHGSLAYGLALFLLSYLWCYTFGEGQTSPAYLAEDYFLTEGNRLLAKGATWARFAGQLLALPLAWRLAALYWQRQLISEHSLDLLDAQHCKSSLGTTSLRGFMVELGCCLLCRLIELLGYKWLEDRRMGKRLVNLLSSLASTLLVVLALDLSGGYFNPLLAAALEFNCQGIQHHEHALVFWLGPILGHIGARILFKRYLLGAAIERQPAGAAGSKGAAGPTEAAKRSNSQRRRRKRQAD